MVHAVLKVLLAEVDSTSREHATRLLREKGQTVVTARTGREVLDRLAREEFGLVIMDINMPEVNGFTIARLLRGSRQGTYDGNQRIPLVALTSFLGILTERECQEYGMECMLKPITQDKLDHVLASARARTAWAPGRNVPHQRGRASSWRPAR